MKQEIEFLKIEATGNDFVVVDKKQISTPLPADEIARLCDRHRGIGADGLILLSGHNHENVTMEYFNADGSAGEMCGNGLRAAGLFGHVLGYIPKNEPFPVLAGDGHHELFYKNSDTIKVQILQTDPVRKIEQQKLQPPSGIQCLGFTVTGVPHLVLATDGDLEEFDVRKIGRPLRNHELFAPRGTNVDFVQQLAESRIRVRTYERGVEDETLSCGTGVVASVLALKEAGRLSGTRIEVRTRGGDLLIELEGAKIFLCGPARIVFAGTLYR